VLLFVVFCERGVDVAVEFSGRVVGDVEQFDRLGAVGRRVGCGRRTGAADDGDREQRRDRPGEGDEWKAWRQQSTVHSKPR
jgi:hypothetical protein